jgi:hypothetical protein
VFQRLPDWVALRFPSLGLRRQSEVFFCPFCKELAMQPMPSVTPMSTERPFPRGQVVVCQYDFNFHHIFIRNQKIKKR